MYMYFRLQIVTAMVLSILSAVGMTTVLSWGIRMTMGAVGYEFEDYENTDYTECGCFDQYDEYTSTMQTICADCEIQICKSGFPAGVRPTLS